MKSSNTFSTMKTPTRTYATYFLLAVGLFAIFYNFLPQFLSASDYLTSFFASKVHDSHLSSKFCTAEIGDGVCCDLFLGAEPCVEECRKEHLDRETFALTKEYEECADKCLNVYQSTCKPGVGAGETDDGAKEGGSKLVGLRFRL